MSQRSNIEWTEATWNPVVGCTKVSPGCKNCYAEKLHNQRHKALLEGKDLPAQYAEPFEKLATMPERLDAPLHWRKPRRIFVNSMSDLFHEDVPFEFIARVFGHMHSANWHTYQILTKRAARMREFVEWYRTTWLKGFESAWPKEYGHVWLGVSVEDQQRADERVPELLRTPAAVRFLSAEPLLGGVLFSQALRKLDGTCNRIDWVICGGESGPGARPMHPDWARGLRDQCEAAGVPFFFKQWGEWVPTDDRPWGEEAAGVKDTTRHCWVSNGESPSLSHHQRMARVGKKAAGRLLDGVLHDAYPELREAVRA